MKKQNITCKICDDFIARSQSFYFHLRDKHNYTTKQYYDEFLKKDNEGKCEECEKATEFLTIMQGYRKFCSRKCQNKNETLRNQRKLTCLKKYGRICAINQKKSKKTKQKRYGDPNFNNQLKAKKTKKQKYGDPTFNNRKKYSKTVFKRYGYYYHTQIPEFIKNLKEHCKNRTEKQRKKIKNKTNKTRLKKYGEEKYGLYGSKGYRLNLKKKYGKENYMSFGTPEFIKKSKKVRKIKYGNEKFTNRQKYKETCLKKYGVDNAWKDKKVSQKCIETKLKKYGKLIPYNGKHSKVSQKLFNILKYKLKNRKSIIYGNKELLLNDGINCIFLDFVDIKTKKCIEFYGDYWHANPKKYCKNDLIKFPNKNFIYAKNIWESDEKRLKIIKTFGFKVLIIWERDFYDFQEKTIKKCLNFLKGGS